MSPEAFGVAVLCGVVGVCCLVAGMVAGFSFRDALERRICGWLPGADDE